VPHHELYSIVNYILLTQGMTGQSGGGYTVIVILTRQRFLKITMLYKSTYLLTYCILIPVLMLMLMMVCVVQKQRDSRSALCRVTEFFTKTAVLHSV